MRKYIVILVIVLLSIPVLKSVIIPNPGELYGIPVHFAAPIYSGPELDKHVEVPKPPGPTYYAPTVENQYFPIRSRENQIKPPTRIDEVIKE